MLDQLAKYALTGQQYSFTPSLITSGTPWTSVSYTVQYGIAYRMGPLVLYSAYVSWNGTSGTPTGSIQVTGFPFTFLNNNFTAGVDYANLVAPGAQTQIIVESSVGSKTVGVYATGPGLGVAGILAASNSGAASRYIIFTSFYMTNDP